MKELTPNQQATEKKIRAFFPPELLSERRWCRYFLKPKPEGGTAKIPLASHSDPNTWSTFPDTIAALERQQGVGYCFLGGDVHGLDIDHCVNPVTKVVCNEAMLLLSRLPSWAEFSVSGQGIHVLFKGNVRGKQLTETCLQYWNPKNAPRFFALTCNMVGDAFRELKDVGDDFNYIFATAAHISAKIREELKTVDHEQWLALPVEREQHEPATARKKEGPQRPRHADFDMVEFLSWAGLPIDNINNNHIGKCYRITTCPIKGEPHVNQNSTSTNFILTAGGGLAFHCQSTGCSESFAEALKKLEEKLGKYPKPVYEENKAPDFAEGVVALQPGQQVHTIQQAEKVLEAMKTPLYCTGMGSLMRPASGGEVKEDKRFKRDARTTILLDVTPEYLIRVLSATQKVVRWDNKKDAEVSADVPVWLVRQLIDRGRSCEGPYLPLRMVRNAPYLAHDGTVIQKNGYHDGVLLDLRGETFPKIPATVTKQDGARALRKLDELFLKFDFVKKDNESWNQTESYAVVLAAFLTVLARPALATCPLFGITAPQAGSGKSLISETLGVAALGVVPSGMTFKPGDEFEKHLPVVLRAGDPIISLENILVPLGDSAVLDQAITSESQRVRVLGVSAEVNVPNTAVFIANGNNLILRADLAQRRALLVALDTNCEHPEERKFDFNPRERAKHHWKEYVASGLTALVAYIEAGTPQQEGMESWGSFEDWNSLIRGALLWYGYADPCNTRKLIDEDNPDADFGRTLLYTWASAFGNQDVTFKMMRSNEDIREMLSFDGEFTNKGAGYKLRTFLKRKIGGSMWGTMKLTRRGHKQGGSQVPAYVLMTDKLIPLTKPKQGSFDGDHKEVTQ
jgi:hypothetical protein